MRPSAGCDTLRCAACCPGCVRRCGRQGWLLTQAAVRSLSVPDGTRCTQWDGLCAKALARL